MTIYEVLADSSRFRSIGCPSGGSQAGIGAFDGRPRGDDWRPPEVQFRAPQLTDGDFVGFGNGVIVVAPRALELVRTPFEMAGELLPLVCGDETFTLLNVLECVDCLDHDATVLRGGAPDPTQTAIQKYAFSADWLPESSLFKIPETASSSIYAIETGDESEDEFKWIVETNGLTGLVFNKVWEE